MDATADGFTGEDRRVLNQLPIILANLNDKMSDFGLRLTRVEETRPTRMELLELEKKLLERFDNFRETLIRLDHEKADISQLPKDAVKAQALQIQQLDDGMRSLREFKIRTVAWAAGASAVITGSALLIGWILELVFKR